MTIWDNLKKTATPKERVDAQHIREQVDAQQRRIQEHADKVQSIQGAMSAQDLQNNIAAHNSAIQSNMLTGVFGTSIGVAMGVGQQAVKPTKEKEGVLFWQGREMPEVWRGAEYKFGSRRFVAMSHQWQVSFVSDFSSDTIMLWLDPDKHSGEEADKIAATYLETINQRRLG